MLTSGNRENVTFSRFAGPLQFANHLNWVIFLDAADQEVKQCILDTETRFGDGLYAQTFSTPESCTESQ